MPFSPNLIESHQISYNLIKSCQISPYLTESHIISPYLIKSHRISWNVPNLYEFHHSLPSVTKSYQILTYLTDSHQISAHLTKTNCQSRISCGTILWGDVFFFEKTLLYLTIILSQRLILYTCRASKITRSFVLTFQSLF